MKYIVIGIIGSSGLLGFYFLILSLVSGWSFARIQFFENWYWILGLSSGFGIQIAIFTYLKNQKAKLSAGVVTASGGTSALAMVSCCSHYLINILPIIGVSGLAAIIGQYQTEFFIIGAVSNLAGIGYLINKAMKLRENKTRCEI
ncbi:MAG: hypothetical protein Q7S60_06045 [bacterium]|nr:hypothetical protein [bacterium]